MNQTPSMKFEILFLVIVFVALLAGCSDDSYSVESEHVTITGNSGPVGAAEAKGGLQVVLDRLEAKP